MADYFKIEGEVFDMMNRVRANPKILVDDLQKMLSYFQGNTYKDPVSRINIITNEGPAAVHEAISFLKSCQSAPPVRLSKGLTQASRDHCYDIGPKGDVSHTGSDGSTMSERMERYGQWNRAIAENISFSEKTGKDIIIQFIIDDGNASRGHRKNLFNNDYLIVGVACGYHKGYEVCCVMDLAAEYEDELEKKQHSKKAPEPQQQHQHHQQPSHQQRQQDPFDRDFEDMKNKFSDMGMGHNRDFANTNVNQHQPHSQAPAHVNIQGSGHQNGHFNEDEDAPEGAVKCSIKKVTKQKGSKKVTQTIKVYTMRDGSSETHEYINEEYM